MFDKNQVVKVRWNNCNKEWFESKGYEFTGFRKYFYVRAKDLMYNSSAIVKAVCDYCDDEYNTRYSIIMKGMDIYPKNACKHCASKKASELSKQKRADKYIGLAKVACEEKGYTLLTTKDEYTDIKMFVDFICHKHGKQSIRLEVLLRGGGCLPCAIEYRARKLSLSADEVEEYINNINGNKLLNKKDYINNSTQNLEILCSCGSTFKTSFATYKDGTNKCKSCSHKQSRGEEIIDTILKENYINFVSEKRFDDCRDKYPLPFDFYLPEYNMCIEFDGQHHFEERHNRNNFETTKRHDEIKNQYCKDNDIDLLRIPYWEGHNIEAIIAEKLNL